MLSTLLLLCAVIFAALATANVPSAPRFVWLPASVLCFLLNLLLGSWRL